MFSFMSLSRTRAPSALSVRDIRSSILPSAIGLAYSYSGTTLIAKTIIEDAKRTRKGLEEDVKWGRKGGDKGVERGRKGAGFSRRPRRAISTTSDNTSGCSQHLKSDAASYFYSSPARANLRSSAQSAATLLRTEQSQSNPPLQSKNPSAASKSPLANSKSQLFFDGTNPPAPPPSTAPATYSNMEESRPHHRLSRLGPRVVVSFRPMSASLPRRANH